MNWKGCERKRLWPSLRLFPIICQQVLRKTTNNLTQDSRCLDRDLVQSRPEQITNLPREGVCVVQRFVAERGMLVPIHSKERHVCFLTNKNTQLNWTVDKFENMNVLGPVLSVLL
jgi:hypothetical protein